MPAAIIELADAVVQDLDSHPFSQNFNIARAYLPRWKLEELTSIRVTVVPKDDVGERASRSQWQEEYQLDVAIQQRLGNDELAQMDDLIFLGQELADHFVDVGGHYKNDEEVIAFLRSRTAPIPFASAAVAVAA